MAGERLRREGRKRLRPYFDTDPGYQEDARAKLNGLVGFDIAETMNRFWNWFPAHGYGEVEVIRAAAYPHLRKKPDSDGNITIVVGISFPEDTVKNAVPLRKARALRDGITALENLEFMYGPERIGLLQWCGAIAKAQRDLKDLLKNLAVREAEERHEDRHLAASSRESEHHRAFRGLTTEIKARTEGLGALLVETLKRVAPPSKKTQAVVGIEDELPGIGEGRPTRHVLGDMEARLSLAGFGPMEIGRLVLDLQRARSGNSPDAIRRHRERIETRIKSRKPAIERRERADQHAG